MTVIRRQYVPQTRELKTISGDMGGVVNDSGSTTIQITYPEGYLDDKNAYIAFTVKDPETNEPFWYSFNGYSFEIPYDVASRVEHNKLGYQLILVGKTNSGYVEQSVIDTCMFARAITDYPDTPLSSVKGIQELNYYRDEVLSRLSQLEALIQNSSGSGGSGATPDYTSLLDQIRSDLSSRTSELNYQIGNIPEEVSQRITPPPDYSSQFEQISSDLSSRTYELSSMIGDIPGAVVQQIVPPPDYGSKISSISNTLMQVQSDISSIQSDTNSLPSSLSNIESEVSGGMRSLMTDISSIGANVENFRMDMTDSSSGVGGKIDYVYTQLHDMENVSPGGSLRGILESIASMVNDIDQRLTALENNNS